jgi:CspA family cold shock protein
MLSGKVRFYDHEKRFGNIASDDCTHDVFVHATALERAGVFDLAEGQQVRYEAARDALTGRMMVTTLQVPLPALGETPERPRLPARKAVARPGKETPEQGKEASVPSR